ncbi:MAG: hypothetical protein DI602_10430 [Aliarcobacter butzleri]|nr:MAG: hypothetical protein DI602_10430 [Aliarcobacter butzleri]
MDKKIPLTKEEIALEILKLATPPISIDSNGSFRNSIESNAKCTAKAYTEILDILNKYQPKS